MQTKIVSAYLCDVQSCLFNQLDRLEGVPYAVALLPVCILDHGLQIAKHPLSSIEAVALAALNLVGAFFSKNYTWTESISVGEAALKHLLVIPAIIVAMPFKMINQVFSGKPQSVHNVLYRGFGDKGWGRMISVAAPKYIPL